MVEPPRARKTHTATKNLSPEQLTAAQHHAVMYAVKLIMIDNSDATYVNTLQRAYDKMKEAMIKEDAS